MVVHHQISDQITSNNPGRRLHPNQQTDLPILTQFKLEKMSQVKINSLNSDKLNIGSLNVRGMNDMLKKKSIKKDLDQYNLNILALQEIKTKGTIIEKNHNRERKYCVCFFPFLFFLV